ncbi:hypothetical protein KIN20_012027 [Parelaphostrongylus tenuis]|uniref:Uncharacterized protein n=1 Tax=Parelaphostrongylus tenuis TaxID=148309 RepID=A0AAD5MAA3_PARTN|nr:hypothetical protein KIN20_012027 [Parelaphostrongylus tenuis]
MVRLPTNPIMVSLLATISTVLGCGVMPAGQGARNMTFTVTSFTTLPVNMVYTSIVNSAKVSGIATSEASAKGFVQRLVMQTVFDVLERQARSALLPDAIISAILGQLTVEIRYNPLSCPLVTSPEEMHDRVAMTENYCIIVGNTVTGICTVLMNMSGKCNMPVNNMVTVTAIDGKHLTISGTLSTTNIIMANWSRAMWQSVVDRAVRMLASSPSGSPFFAAVATVGGN